MNLLNIINENCIKYSEQICQIYKDSNLTYGNLKKYSDALSKYIISEYGEDKSPIVIYGHKEHEMLISFLACSKSGHAYIPIDTTFPKDRINDIIESSKPKLFINIGNINIDNFDGKMVSRENLNDIFNKFSGLEPSKSFYLKENDVYYMLYTSGSTGKPKGVQITYKALEAFIEWFMPYCKTSEDKNVFLNQVSYSFDVSVISIYIGLLLGKTLYVIDKQMTSNFKDLFENLSISKIAMWISTPSFAEMCIVDNSFNKNLLPELEKMFFAGEILSKKLVSTLYERFGDISIINGYGPTEATVLITAVEVNKHMLNAEDSIPIGYGMDNSRVFLINDAGKEIKDGEKGEICVVGDNVSIGYYNNEEMNKKHFFTAEDGTKPGYKTGDLAYKKDDMFYYCGRKDFQIKLNGFRIELEDIENNLRKLDYVSNAVALPVKHEEKISYIAAFVKLSKSIDEKEFKIAMKIKNDLSKFLPSYMIPRKVKLLNKFPINTNGKIDRKLLQEDLK
ncbi:D-alanine--poly(phosphoribitol) ligase subunit DltA [Clostridium hydrogenum]|uniref:D-alanine--poly(phosphoribitol) ligase subunit DltA n=1 Tax=Clostridium hydrogenum TaxID=2855764 RepID=UPI001F36F388|nr:D-alanine--poly(phosphoribitol) ligase subunit DltA [Clostridium hydrogenum]